MAMLVHPNKTVNVTTENGECNINITLDLNINLSTEALELIGSSKKGKSIEEEEKVEWEIPEFTPSTNKVQFGKNI